MRLLAVIALVCLSGLSETTWSHQAAPGPSDVAIWKADLQFLATQLPKLHVNPFSTISAQAFLQSIERATSRIGEMRDDERLVELSRIVAAIGDAHTGIAYRPKAALPLMLYRFRDGLFITNVTEDRKIDQTPGARLVVDLRNNGGGDSGIFEPLLNGLKARPAFRQKGALFVVIGRQTFSSAVLNAVELKRDTAAVFVGEPTGGKPNHFGEVRTVKLPGTGLDLSYSTKYFKESSVDTPSLDPDLRVDLTIADLRAKRDPVMAAILATKTGARQP